MRGVKYILLLCIFTFFTGGTTFPAGEVSETGSTGMSFLRIAPTARIASLGGGSSALYTGAAAVWANPSLIALQTVRSVQFTHIEWIEGIRQESAVISTSEKFGNLGFAVQLFDSGDIELRGSYPSRAPLGTYSIKNAAFSLCYAGLITENIALGLTYKKLFEKISMETAGGDAVDLGMTVKTPFNGLSLAATARNYGRMDKLRNDRTKLPSDISVGCLYSGMMPGFEQSFLIVGDLVVPQYGDPGLRFGLEIEPLNHFVLRGGYRTDSDIQTMSFGVGLGLESITADVSYTPMKEGFDDSLCFTLSLTGF